MASRNIKKRPDGMWRARYRDETGKEHAKHFDRKRDGERWLDEQTAATVTGQWVDPTDKTTVAQYARIWAAGRPHKARTAKRISSLIKNHIEGTALGARQLKSVLPSQAQAWVTDRSGHLADSTLASLVSLVRSVYKAAIYDKLAFTSPFAQVKLPAVEGERIVPLTVDQVRRLAFAVPDRYIAMVITQAGLGLRVGELLALRVQDVDFLRREVRIEWQIPSNESQREEPKTTLSKRTVPLPTFVAEALAAHIGEFPALADGSLFYSNQYKHPYSQTHYSKRIFKPAAAAVGLPAGTTSHDLRHHYASVLLHAGESVVAVAERLGHKNANLVIRTYGHLMPDSEERTRKAMDDAWGAADQVRTSGSIKAV